MLARGNQVLRELSVTLVVGICRGDRILTYLIYKVLVALCGSYNCHYVKFSGRRRPPGTQRKCPGMSAGISLLPETRAEVIQYHGQRSKLDKQYS